MQARSFASVLPDTTAIAESSDASAYKATSAAKDGSLRPHLGIQVNPDHGLYAFFRKKEDDKGNVRYETVEPLQLPEDAAGMFTLMVHGLCLG